MSTPDQLTSISTQLISYIYSMGRISFLKSEESYQGWSLLICDEGTVQYRVGEYAGELHKGEAVLCPPGEIFYRKALTTFSFHFAVFHLRTYAQDKVVNFPYYGKLMFRNKTQFLLNLEDMRDSRESVSSRYTEHLLNHLLYEVIREKANRNKERKPVQPAITEALRFIHEHAFKEVSIQSAADHVNMYQSQFSRKFQKEMGISPSHYLARLRLQNVIRLLTETDHSLEYIAHHSGYQNAFYLSRVFSKEMKMSPSHYRNTHRV